MLDVSQEDIVWRTNDTNGEMRTRLGVPETEKKKIYLRNAYL